MNFITKDFMLKNEAAKKLYAYAETLPIIDQEINAVKRH